MTISAFRSRWAAIGAAVAVCLGAGGIGITQATTSSGEMPVYLPIEPCRLADTRPDFLVGPRATPLGADEAYTLSGWGTVGECTLPNGSTALSLNVTAVDATQPTFLTLYPADATRPNASHLNPAPGQPPTPNAVNVDLDTSGEFKIFNKVGTVHVIIDVVGYYEDHVHNDLYYTKAQIDSALDDKTDADDAMFAKVASDGTLTAGTPGVTVTKPATPGRYIVRFPRDVSTCAFIVQNNLNNGNVASELVYFYTTTPNDPNDLFVYFEDESGTPDDREFSLIVMC